MSLDDCEHVAWRMIVHGQELEGPESTEELAVYLDEQVSAAGGSRWLIFGLSIAAGQAIRALAEATGEEPLTVAQRLRDAHAVELMDIHLDDDSGEGGASS
jgi:hypothetical protein